MELSKEEKQRQAAKLYLDSISKFEKKEINVIVPKEFSKKLRSYFLIGENLKFITNIIEELLKLIKANLDEDSIVMTSLFQSISVTYGKIFTKSKSGFSNLEANYCFKGHDKLRNSHDKLMELRNKFVAHREDSEHEYSLAFLKLNFEGAALIQVNYKLKVLSKSTPSINDINEYIILFEFLSKIIDEKINDESTKVWETIKVLQRDQFLLLILDENSNAISNI